MELSEQQRQAVKEWVAAGSSLSDVQKSLKTGKIVTWDPGDTSMSPNSKI